jgi:hypothetical protein
MEAAPWFTSDIRAHLTRHPNPWIRWTALLHTLSGTNAAHFPVLLGLTEEMFAETRMIWSALLTNWDLFSHWYGYILNALIASPQRDIVVPHLRQVLLRIQHFPIPDSIAEQIAVLEKEEIPEDDFDAQFEAELRSIVDAREIYQAHLLFALGMCEAWGILAHVALPQETLLLWMAQMATGAALNKYLLSGIPFTYETWYTTPDTQNYLRSLLQRHFGLSEQEISTAMSIYEKNNWMLYLLIYACFRN